MNEETADRIASSLERIAAALEQSNDNTILIQDGVVLDGKHRLEALAGDA